MHTLIMLTTLPLTARGGVNTTFRPAPCIANPNSAIPYTPSTMRLITNTIQILTFSNPFHAI